jgi:hypothetical protein
LRKLKDYIHSPGPANFGAVLPFERMPREIIICGYISMSRVRVTRGWLTCISSSERVKATSTTDISFSTFVGTKEYISKMQTPPQNRAFKSPRRSYSALIGHEQTHSNVSGFARLCLAPKAHSAEDDTSSPVISDSGFVVEICLRRMVSLPCGDRIRPISQ